MSNPAKPVQKKIVLTYTGENENDLDIKLDSENFGDDVEMITIYLSKTIKAILDSEGSLSS